MKRYGFIHSHSLFHYTILYSTRHTSYQSLFTHHIFSHLKKKYTKQNTKHQKNNCKRRKICNGHKNIKKKIFYSFHFKSFQRISFFTYIWFDFWLIKWVRANSRGIIQKNKLFIVIHNLFSIVSRHDMWTVDSNTRRTRTRTTTTHTTPSPAQFIKKVTPF